VPVVASGGAGTVDDVVDVVKRSQPSGVAIAALLHYDIVGRTKTGASGPTSFARIAPASLGAVKAALVAAGCRTRVPRMRAGA
jgi:hypothetical protein